MDIPFTVICLCLLFVEMVFNIIFLYIWGKKK